MKWICIGLVTHSHPSQFSFIVGQNISKSDNVKSKNSEYVTVMDLEANRRGSMWQIRPNSIISATKVISGTATFLSHSDGKQQEQPSYCVSNYIYIQGMMQVLNIYIYIHIYMYT